MTQVSVDIVAPQGIDYLEILAYKTMLELSITIALLDIPYLVPHAIKTIKRHLSILVMDGKPLAAVLVG